jgi:hypothetical protein
MTELLVVKDWMFLLVISALARDRISTANRHMSHNSHKANRQRPSFGGNLSTWKLPAMALSISPECSRPAANIEGQRIAVSVQTTSAQHVAELLQLGGIVNCQSIRPGELCTADGNN